MGHCKASLESVGKPRKRSLALSLSGCVCPCLAGARKYSLCQGPSVTQPEGGSSAINLKSPTSPHLLELKLSWQPPASCFIGKMESLYGFAVTKSANLQHRMLLATSLGFSVPLPLQAQPRLGPRILPHSKSSPALRPAFPALLQGSFH